MENLDTSTSKIKNDNDTSTAEISNIGNPKTRLNRKQRRNIKFGRNIWKQKNRRLNKYKI